MKWQRVEPGRYVAGPYTVRPSQLSGKFWVSNGPGIEQTHWHLKADAQAECQRVAEKRDPSSCIAIVRDHVIVTDGQRRGYINTIQRIGDMRPLYCIHLPRGRILCRYRDEFEVVVP